MPNIQDSFSTGLLDTAETILALSVNTQRTDIGIWLYRDASAVPAPTPLMLVSLGVLALLPGRRVSKAQNV